MTIDIVHTGERKEDCVWCNLYLLAKTEYNSKLDPLHRATWDPSSPSAT